MFEFGFYEKEITPPLGCGIPGYFNIRRGCDVLDRLYARAVVVKDECDKIAIISVDGLHPKKDICDNIAKRIQEYTGISRENVMIAFTHSHTATPFRFEEIAFIDDDIVADSIKGYIDVFTRLVADCVILADLRLQKAIPAFAKDEVYGISFCRDYYMKNSTPRTNPPRTSPEIIGPVTESDKELPILMVRDECQNPLGAIIGFACHADCIGGEKYSGDYVSVLSKELKKVYGEDFVTVFLLGCCGDVNHIDVSIPSDPKDHYVRMGEKLAKNALNAINTAKTLEKTGVRSTLEYIKVPRRYVDPEKIEEAKNYIEANKDAGDDLFALGMAKKLMRFLDTTPENIDVPLQCIQIGEFTIYGFNSEIFSEFGKIVKKGDGTGVNLVATLCNDAFGYVPTRDMFFDTIYESRPGSSRLDTEAGYIMAEKLVSMKK